ncbi:hypothetical protein TraAM80_07807 [Trypanosoma rangeli]|uniref:Uncharacterized protein n=1 Tax=Trypanosoma rangeli TaxID=5698 RepID=A0A3R7K414_TRYRA|nr:uncharacterized protein TraAM80_07807 [Trypanosoma rangeli]RNF00099.1 hypothetical protein TraAM80_07807 [Trypanosoma rangeli]|eukprot:RNF00099.1 hypothetical protein TraAM80_07807 [Trypanosoma rangeli]
MKEGFQRSALGCKKWLDNDLQAACAAAFEEVASLKRQVVELQNAKEQEEEKVAVQAGEPRDLQKQLSIREKDCAEVSHMYEETAFLIRDGATSVEGLLQEKRARIEELEVQVQKMSQQALLTEEQLRFVSVEAQQLRQELDECTEKYLNLEAVHRALGADLREAKRLLEERQRTWSQRLEGMQGDMEKQMCDAAEEVHRIRYEHEQEGNGLRREIDRLQAELQAVRTLAATKQITAQGSHHQLEHLRQQLTEALDEKTQFAAELEATQQLLHKKELLLRGQQQGDDALGVVGDSSRSSDARISSLLQRSEALEGKVRQLTSEKDTLLQEKDALELALQSTRHMVEVRDLACQRQTDEVKQMRAQVAAMKEDLSFRVQSCNALRQELNEAQEQAAELARAYEDFQQATFAEQRVALLREHMEALFLAKVMTIPRVIQDVLHGIMWAYQRMLRHVAENQRKLLARCDAIEQTATDAMMEGERQSNEFLVAIEDAKVERQQLQAIIERLEQEIAAANRIATAATEETAAVTATSTEAARDAREAASRAKSDLQALQLDYDAALNTISMLETEKVNAARLLARANARIEEVEAEQQGEVAQLQAALLEKTQSLRDAQAVATQRLEAAERQVDQYKVQRDDAAKQAQTVQASLDRVLPRLERLEAERAEREAELMDATQQLTALTQRSTSAEMVARRHMEALNATLAELRSSQAALSEKCAKAYAQVDELRAQLTASETEVGRLRTRTAQQEQEVKAAHARLSELESTYVHDTSDAATWRRDAERRYATLEHRNSALLVELQTSQQQQASLQEHADALEAKLRQAADEHRDKDQQQRRSIQQLRERCDALEGDLVRLEEAHAKITAERDALNRDCLSAKQDVERLEHHLEATNRHNEQLHKELRHQKESHDAEIQTMRKTLEGARGELNECRATFLEAETQLKEVRHVAHTLEKDNIRGAEELARVRGLASAEQESMEREREEKQAQVAELHEEVLQLQKELYAARQECKVLESNCTRNADDAELWRRQLTDMTDHYRALQQDAAEQQEQLTAALRSFRAEATTLQSKLDDAMDALAQKQRESEQCEERHVRKMELSRLAEETLRREVTDLQRDVQQLQQRLTAATNAAHETDRIAAQQQVTIRALSEELGRFKTQSATDTEEREDLQTALRERTLELERVTRNAAADLERLLANTNELHRSNADSLEAELRREQQAAQEARTARDRALESLEQRGSECEMLQAEVTRLRQMLRSAQAQVSSTRAEVESTVSQAAMEVGLPQDGEVSLSRVINELLLRLSRSSHGAAMLDVEVSHFKSFENACEAHAAALRYATDATRLPLQIVTSGAAPNSPLVQPHESSSGSSVHSLRHRPMPSHPLVVRDIVRNASTYAHRLMEHCRTLRGMLENMQVMLAQCDTTVIGDPAVTRVKLVFMATLSELHLRTSRQTTLLYQIADGAIISTALQETARVLRDDEAYVMRPFNELLTPSSFFASTSLRTPRWSCGGSQESASSATSRASFAESPSVGLYLQQRSCVKMENEHSSRGVPEPQPRIQGGNVPGEGPRRSSMAAAARTDAAVTAEATVVGASEGRGCS